MRQVVVFGFVTLVTSVLLPAVFTVQEPLVSWGDTQPSISAGVDDIYMEWNLEEPPNINATDHLVFETAHSLLQHWPNTRMRNGHNIVPGVIPKGTLLYHGTSRNEVPMGPEWTSLDPEHSYFFCWEVHPKQGCWHLTLVAARPLKVVYFDGTSAAKLPYGSMDTQDLIMWGGPRPDGEWDEKRRIQDLCTWGKKFGVDGIVRMEVDFEIMFCDFTSGLRVVSFANLALPGGVRSPTSGLLAFQVMIAGSWHRRFPGETRIELDLAGLVSLYDIQLAPSLVAARAGQERWDHRAASISDKDLSAVKSRLEAALIRPSGLSSGIDWKTLIQVIVDRFVGRLELARRLLNSTATDPSELVDVVNKTQSQFRIMLTPYLLLSATPTNPSDKSDLRWARSIYRHCATAHTDFVVSELDSMTDSETALLKAVRGTSREICRVVTKMWATGVHTGIDPSLNTKESLDVTEVARLRSEWAADLDRLMAWLDWSIWIKCDPDCGPEEICYLPMWPFGFPGFPRKRSPPLPSDDDRPQERLTGFELGEAVMGRLVEEGWRNVKSEPNEWIRPQPKCIRQVDTYDF